MAVVPAYHENDLSSDTEGAAIYFASDSPCVFWTENVLEYDRGFTAGYLTGAAAGQGQAIALLRNQSSGYDDGFADGLNAGQQRGIAIGRSTATMTSDLTSPTVTYISPSPNVTPGDPGGFPSDPTTAMTTPVVVEVTDINPGVQYVAVFVKFLELTDHIEVVYRRGQFVGLYAAGSSVAIIPNGLQLTIQRTGGWYLDKIAISSLEILVDAVDASGNLQ